MEGSRWVTAFYLEAMKKSPELLWLFALGCFGIGCFSFDTPLNWELSGIAC